MNVAIISSNQVTNIAVFEDLQTAQEFLEAGHIQADTVVELPEGHGIGSLYDGTNFSHPNQTDPKEDKLLEVASACEKIIYDGITVLSAEEAKHYSLNMHDQTEIIAQLASIKEGAPAVPYHADGELCRLYSAEEFSQLAQQATAHIFYHRTYCNHLNQWINRATEEELSTIHYGADLPPDLQQHMMELIQNVQTG